MKATMIFPLIMIVLDLLAAIVYICDADWRRAIYWTAAAILTGAVTL